MKQKLLFLRKMIPMLALAGMMMAPSWGWGQTAVYKITSKTAVSTTGTAPSGSNATYSQTYNTVSQITSGNSATLTLSGYEGYKITSIVLSMKSNSSKGAGTLSVIAGSTTISSVNPTAKFNTASWYGDWSTTYVDVTKTPAAYTIGSGENVVINIAATENSLYIESYDITYESAAATPTISLNPTALNDFTYVVGSGPSAEQTFTVSGSNLTADISIAATTNYEISTSTGGSFSPTNPITLSHTAGTVDETTVYVRLKSGLALGDYNGEITATSTGATDKTVTVSGSVTAPPPPDAPVATAASAISETGFTAKWNTVVGATGYFLDVYHDGGSSSASDLIISEYIEGSSNNKAIEIYNGTGNSVDLANYSLQKQSNGSGNFGSELVLSGTLASGTTYVIVNNQSSAELKGYADLISNSGSLAFNGNDAVALYKSGVQIDLVGVVDQTSDWGKDVTLVRKSSITSPTISYLLSDWDSYNVDEFSYLGSHTMGAGPTYDLTNESVGNVTSYAVTGLTSGTTYKYVVRATNASGTSENSNEIEVTTTGNVAPEITNVVHTPANGINPTVAVSVSADVTDSDGTIEGVELHWGTVSGSLGNTINMSLAGGNTYTTDDNIPAQAVNTTVFYEIYALDDDAAETTSPEQSYFVFYGEPTNHAADFSAAVDSPTFSAIKVIWIDASGGTVPEAYVIKASTISYGDITAPIDGTEETEGSLVKIVAQGVNEASFTGLDGNTPYYFKIWPFTNSGVNINYKTNESVPEATATTTVAPGSGLQIVTAATAYTIDFDNTVEGVNYGQFNASGFTPEPTVGQLNSNAWSVTGMSDGDLDFGGSETTGDFIKGISSGGVSSGGVYAFEVAGSDYALGFQPTASDWAPGTVALKIQNQTSAFINSIEIVYTVYIYNDQGRSSSFNFSHSDDNTIYTAIPSLYLTSEEGADGSPAWKAYKRVERITGLNLADKAYYYFKWSSEDVSGGGSRDEFAIDDISIVVNPTDAYPLAGTFEEVVLGANAAVVIAEDATVTVEGTFTNNAGAAGLVISSDATGTGSLIHNTNNTPATIKRYITGNSNTNLTYDYHTVSVPLNTNGTAGMFMGSYLYKFNTTTQQLEPMGESIDTPLPNNQGYMIFYPNASITYEFAGQLNNGDFIIPTAQGLDKFTLAPNPYPSAIDWDAAAGWTKTNLHDSYWVWNPDADNYATYGTYVATLNATQYIPAGQAFFVKASAAASALTLKNEARLHNNQAFFKNNSAVENLLRVKTATAESADEMVVRFISGASSGQDEYDIDKIIGGANAPQLYSLINPDRMVTVNTLNYSAETQIVPMAYELSNDETASLTFEGVDSFEPTIDIFLEDLLTKQIIDLREQTTYSFEHEADNDPLRFKIHFKGVTGINELASADKNFSIWASGKKLYVYANTAVDGSLQIDLFDLSGRLLQTVQQPKQSPNSISLPDYEGIIMVRVRNNSFVQTEKVFIR